MIYSQIMINKCYRKNICMANKSCLLRELLYLIINERSSRTKVWSLSLIPLRYSIVDKNLTIYHIYLSKNFGQLFFEIILLFTDTEMSIQKMNNEICSYLQIVYRKRHMRLVRGFLRRRSSLVLLAPLNHQAILPGPVIQRSRMSLCVAFQCNRMVRGCTNQLVRYPQHRGDCNEKSDWLAHKCSNY